MIKGRHSIGIAAITASTSLCGKVDATDQIHIRINMNGTGSIDISYFNRCL